MELKKVNILATCAALLLVVACQQQANHTFVVQGTIKCANGKTLLLAELPFNQRTRLVTDSVSLDSTGRYRLSTPAQPECFYQLFLKDGPGFLLINDALSITVDADALQPELYKIAGSAASKSIQSFDGQLQQLYQNWQTARRQLDSVNTLQKMPDSLKMPFKDAATSAKENMHELLRKTISQEQNGTAQYYMLGYTKAIATDTVWQALYAQALEKHPKHAGLLGLVQQ